MIAVASSSHISPRPVPLDEHFIDGAAPIDYKADFIDVADPLDLFYCVDVDVGLGHIYHRCCKSQIPIDVSIEHFRWVSILNRIPRHHEFTIESLQFLPSAIGFNIRVFAQICLD